MDSVSTHRSKPQLLRYFGFFHCRKCNNSWRSAHVYCDSKTLKVKYKQKCQDCKTFYKPYKIDDIKCRNCGEAGKECYCERKGWGLPQEQHRRSLCEKCLLGRDPCDLSSYPKGPSIDSDSDDGSDSDDNDDHDYNKLLSSLISMFIKKD